MEETLFIITHSIMAICCIWIIVVGMNFKREESVIIINRTEKPAAVNIAKVIEDKNADTPLNEVTGVRGLQLTMD